MAVYTTNKIMTDSDTFYIVPAVTSTSTAIAATKFVQGISYASQALQVTYSDSMSTSGSITAANFTSTSDARLKNSITNTLIDYNNILGKLSIRDFYFNSDETKSSKQIGLVAQELEAIIPDDYKNCFIKKDDNGYYSINEDKLVYLALLKIKELEQRIAKLENK